MEQESAAADPPLAFAHMEKADVRYRFVSDMALLEVPQV